MSSSTPIHVPSQRLIETNEVSSSLLPEKILLPLIELESKIFTGPGSKISVTTRKPGTPHHVNAEDIVRSEFTDGIHRILSNNEMYEFKYPTIGSSTESQTNAQPETTTAPPLFHNEESSNPTAEANLPALNFSVVEPTKFDFALNDGTKVHEESRLRDNSVLTRSGRFEYISPEGIPVVVQWIADEQGFRVLQ